MLEEENERLQAVLTSLGGTLIRGAAGTRNFNLRRALRKEAEQLPEDATPSRADIEALLEGRPTVFDFSKGK